MCAREVCRLEMADALSHRRTKFCASAISMQCRSHFDEAFQRNTNYGFALQRFLYYQHTNHALDELAMQYINGKQTVVFVCNEITPSNSPIKGYVRTKVRQLVGKNEKFMSQLKGVPIVAQIVSLLEATINAQKCESKMSYRSVRP